MEILAKLPFGDLHSLLDLAFRDFREPVAGRKGFLQQNYMVCTFFFFCFALQKTGTRTHLCPTILSLKSQDVATLLILYCAQPVSRVTTWWAHVWVPRDTFSSISLQQTIDYYPFIPDAEESRTAPCSAPHQHGPLFPYFPDAVGGTSSTHSPEIRYSCHSAPTSPEWTLQVPASSLSSPSPGWVSLMGPKSTP